MSYNPELKECIGMPVRSQTLFAVCAGKTDARIEQASDEEKRHIIYPSFLLIPLCVNKGKQKDVTYAPFYKNFPYFLKSQFSSLIPVFSV